MSYSRETTIWCDGDMGGYSCGHWTQAGGTAKAARAHAKSEGWTRTKDGKDLCPTCAAKAPAEKPACQHGFTSPSACRECVMAGKTVEFEPEEDEPCAICGECAGQCPGHS